MPAILREKLTHQIVYPLNWDEHEKWVEVNVCGQRQRFSPTDLETLDGKPLIL